MTFHVKFPTTPSLYIPLISVGTFEAWRKQTLVKELSNTCFGSKLVSVAWRRKQDRKGGFSVRRAALWPSRGVQLLDLHFLSIIIHPSPPSLPPLSKCSGTFTFLKRGALALLLEGRSFQRQISLGLDQESSKEAGGSAEWRRNESFRRCRSICRIVTRYSQQFDLTGASGAEAPLDPF